MSERTTYLHSSECSRKLTTRISKALIMPGAAKGFQTTGPGASKCLERLFALPNYEFASLERELTNASMYIECA
jgi:hypothetical protein